MRDEGSLSNGKQEFITFMLDAGVLRLGDFVTKSGRRTPYFINTGNYKTGAQIAALGRFYAAAIYDTCADGFDALFGPAYKGIPLATAAAAALAERFGVDKPFFFNRKEVKDHGEGGLFVGYQPKDGDRVAIIEDVITAGTAVRETLPLLRACGDVRVEHMFISVDRCEVGADPGRTAVQEVRDEFGIAVHPLVTAMDIYGYLCGRGGQGEATAAAMKTYMDKYCLF